MRSPALPGSPQPAAPSGPALPSRCLRSPCRRPAALGGIVLLAAFAALGVRPATAQAGDARERLEAAVASPERSAESRQRDAARHPVETLLFFDIQPDDTVLELWPGSGWYTEILGPYLKEKGQLVATNYDPDGPQEEYIHRAGRKYAARLEQDAGWLGPVETIVVTPPDGIALGPDERFDAVVTFRNNHNWIRDGYQDRVYAEAFRVLKPGGTLGVVQHRAPEGADPEASAKTGYVPESAIIEAAEEAGFELAGRSEVNANPRDTKDHPEGVWTLPPSYRLDDVDREKYAAIGESDRMTLRFVKPAPQEASR